MDNREPLSRQDARRELMLTSQMHSIIPKMALPAMVSMVIMSLYNMADTYFVSSLGIEATGAVGVNASLLQFIQMSGSFFAFGANSFIARLMGAGRDEDASRVLSFSFFSAMFLGVLATVLGLTFMPQLVRLLGARDPLVARYSTDYASYILYFAPFMVPSFVMNQCLRAEGSSTFSMIGMVSGAVVNVVLDPIFIFGLHMGVAGAAAATGISKTITFLVLLTPYLRRHSLLHLSIRKWRPSREIVTEVAKMGLPTLLRSALMTAANVLTNNVASGFSAAALAAVSIVNRIMTFMASAIMGFGQGYQPVAGFNWGAKRYDRVKSAYRFAAAASMTTVTILGVAAIVFARPIIGIFSDNQETLRLGAFCLRAQCLALPAHAWVMIVNSTYSALGKARGAAILGVARQGICFIPMVVLLPALLGVWGLASAQGAADLLSVAVALPMAVHVLREINRLTAENSLMEVTN